MTDLPPDTAALVKRRLTGLMVLLLLVFLLGLLQHRQNETLALGLKSIVITLDGNAPASAVPTPMPAEEEVAAVVVPDTDEAPLLPVEPPLHKVAETPVEPVPEKSVAKAPVSDKPKLTEATKPKPKPAIAPRWYVAVGAFKDEASARAVGQRVRQAGFKVETRPILSTGVRLKRVLAGPFNTADGAETARATLIVEGLTKAAVVAEK